MLSLLKRYAEFLQPQFGGGGATPAPVPVAPTSDPQAEAKRMQAERDAIEQQRLAGRRSTVVGGMALAEDEQLATGEAAAKRRATLG